MDERLLMDTNIQRNNFKLFVIIWIVLFLAICSDSSIVSDKISCPSICVCKGTKIEGVEVECIGKNLTSVPQDLDDSTIKL